MRSTVLWILVSICVCFTAVSAAKRSSSSSNYYTEPLCEFGDPLTDGFYCKTSTDYSCPPRTQRCTTDCASDQCTSKSYKNCDYNQASGKFRIKVYSTVLESVSWVPFIENSDTAEHRFVTYRGLMYEYGKDYDARVQDPNDPNYEYNKRPTKSPPKSDGSSTCTYEQVLPYLNFWKKDEYKLLNPNKNNCHDFVVGLTNHLQRNCAILSKYRKRSDDDLAEYFFNISLIDCTMSDSDSTDPTTSYSGASTSEKPLIALAAVVIVGLAMW